MNLQETTPRKNSISIISMPFVLMALFIGFVVSEFTNHKQYKPTESGKQLQHGGNKHNALQGMEKYFFDARKNPQTNKSDYAAMVAAANEDRSMRRTKSEHNSSTTSVLPAFNWTSLGPINIGGHTSCILVDNQDRSHQTLFAGLITGGIWKSTNGGATWGSTNATIAFSQDDTMENMNINCLTQDRNGVLYAGTGDGFTEYSLTGSGSEYGSGQLGDGIFKSTDDGITWTHLAATTPTPVDEFTVAWAYVNRIAVSPIYPNILYAATNTGVYISHNAGISWSPCVKSSTQRIGGFTGYNSLDIKISNDGSVVICNVGAPNSNTYICYPFQTAPNDSLFTEVPTTGAGHLNGNAVRIEYAFSPTDPNRIYASVINNSNSFCRSILSGIFMTETAQTNGGYWYDIGPGGSTAFDPYIVPSSTDDEGNYANAMAVSPTNEGELLVGGTTVWKWTQASSTDTLGLWDSMSDYFNTGGNDPRYIHPDEFTLTFNPGNSNTVYVGCDNGVYKSTDNAVSWNVSNQNFVGADFYTLCIAPLVSYMNVNIGNSNVVEGFGMGGGTQNDGTLYTNGTGSYPDSARNITGGWNGGGCVVSEVNPNIAYFADYGSLYKESNLPNLLAPQNAYTTTSGNCMGGDIDSVWRSANSLGAANFVFPVALYESRYDTLNSDSLEIVATVNYFAGDTVYPTSANSIYYPYVLPRALSAGDSMRVPDRVVSRLAIGFSGAGGGIWINGQAASNNGPIWKPIGGPLSKPDAYNTYSFDSPHAITWSPNGDALFVGTEGGNLFRFSNLNKVVANNYCSGALWYLGGGIHATGDTTVISRNISFRGFSGKDILSIDVDPLSGNHILVTTGGYAGSGSDTNIWLSTNALIYNPTFKCVQGNLPPMPVYSAILDVLDSLGHSIPGSAMVATEHGVYSTTNINAASVVWTKNNNGMANCLTFVIKQQTLPTWECNNSGAIYLATYGRGIWGSNELMPKLPTSLPTVKSFANQNSLLIYPNPMNTNGNMEFTLASSDHVILSIYDMQGKEIKTMDLSTLAPGKHIVPFGTEGLSAGTYFAALSGTGFRKVGKFMVVK